MAKKSLIRTQVELSRQKNALMAERIRARLAAKQKRGGYEAGELSGDTFLASVDFSFGDVNNQNLDVHDMRWREAPDDIKEAFRQARRWAKQNYFVKTILNLKLLFFSWGLKIQDAAEEPEKPRGSAALPGKKKPKIGFDDLLAETDDQQRTLGSRMHAYAFDCCREWLTSSNIVTFWRGEDDEAPTEWLEIQKRLPFLLLPEHVEYSDKMGIEKLFWCPGWKKIDLEADATGMNEKDIRRYTSAKVWLRNDPKDPREDEHYTVTAKGIRGTGLAWPDMYTIFRTLTQNESMEVGEAQYAMLGRTPIEFHKIGFEPKNQHLAPVMPRFLYKKSRATDINKFMSGAKGLVRLIGQFDHTIDYVWTDPQKYLGDKWQTVLLRMAWWAGPLARILEESTPNPQWLQVLGAEMNGEGERPAIADHIERMLNGSLLEPHGLACKVTFKDDIFQDPKLAFQKMTDMVDRGALSLKTFTHHAGFDREREKKHKIEEAKDPEESYLPLYDPNHGKDGTPGRPEGSKDGGGSNPGRRQR